MNPDFITYDFKTNDLLRSDERQRIMAARREAHLFDVSQEVSEEILDVLENTNWPIHRLPHFPCRTGYLRMNYAVDIKPEDEALFGLTEASRLTGMLWHNGWLYFFHDNKDDRFGFMPYKASMDFDLSQYDEAKTPIVGQRGTAICALNLEEITSVKLPVDSLQPFAQAIRDFIAVAIVAFDMFGEIGATVQESEKVPHTFQSKNKPYFERTSLVKINLRKCRTKYLRERAEPTGRRIGYHEPRGHFCHYRITNPNCQHVWVPRLLEDDGKKYKCQKCGEWKTWRELPNGRGSKEIGTIHTHYEVVR